MKICINSIGFSEERKLNVANGLRIGGIVLGIVGLAATIISHVVESKSTSWYRALTNEEIDKIANTAYAFDKTINNG